MNQNLAGYIPTSDNGNTSELAGRKLDPVVTAGIITGGAAVISTILNYISNTRNNSATRSLASQAYIRDRAAWAESAAWNSEKSQVERMQLAGLSPALAMSGGVSSSMPLAGAAPIASQQPYFTDPLTSAQVSKLTADAVATSNDDMRKSGKYPFEIEAIQRSNENLKSLTSLNYESIKESITRQGVNEQLANLYSKQVDDLTITISQRYATFQSDIQAILDKNDITHTDMLFAERKAEAMLSEIEQSINESKARCIQLKSQAKKDSKEADYLQKQIDGYETILEEVSARTSELKEQADLVRSEKAYQDEENRIQKEYGEKKAKEELKKAKQERICGYINSASGAVRDVGVGVGACIRGGVALSTVNNVTETVTTKSGNTTRSYSRSRKPR